MLFKGIFNWYCELHVLYTHAKSEGGAWGNFVIQLAKLLNVSRRSIYIYFINEKKDNWEIKEVKKTTNAKEN